MNKFRSNRDHSPIGTFFLAVLICGFIFLMGAVKTTTSTTSIWDSNSPIIANNPTNFFQGIVLGTPLAVQYGGTGTNVANGGVGALTETNLTSSSGNLAFNPGSSFVNAKLTITENTTFLAPSNLTAGQVYILTVIEDGTGGWTLSGNTNRYKLPDGGGSSFHIMTNANAISIITLYARTTNLYCNLSTNF